MSKLGLVALALCSAAAVALVLVPCAVEWLRTRTLRERLERPVAVRAVECDGMTLEDGRRVDWTLDIEREELLAFVRHATRAGVELDEHGRVTGLVTIWHWCGNDPIARHVARVDVRELLEFFAAHAMPSRSSLDELPDWSDEHGWNVSQWRRFEAWRGGDPNRSDR